MKIYIFLIILWLFSPFYMFSKSVDSIEAKQIALNYYMYLNPSKSYVSIKKTITKQYKGFDTQHIIIFDNLDFIIVSADDATVPIFAYSNENSFNENDIPPSFELWLRTEYDELVYYVKTNNISNENTIQKWNAIKEKKFDKSKATKSVTPLINTHWGQSFTNDLKCPGYNFFVEENISCNCFHCTAGCVAVAMAQIMRYWKSPVNNFDWCNMPNELIKKDNFGNDRSEYEVERNAIAYLISDCGGKAEMDYCKEIDGEVTCNSGTTIGKAKRVLQNDYNYSNDMLHSYRWLTISWKQKMRNSLDNVDPILYGGQSVNVGHAFICDGYQEENYFHFNWGWNGNSDGYFYIDDDDGSNVIDYKKWQEAVFYIHPEQQSNVHCVDCSEIISISNSVSSINPYNTNFPMITWIGISPIYNYIPLLNPIKPLASEIIYENGEMRLEYFDITAGTINVDNVIIPDKTNVHLKAYNEIVITNFETVEGAEFTAEIIPCPDNTNFARIDKKDNTNINELELTKEVYHEIFQINPNPCSYETNIIYSIAENGFFEISIYDIYGKKIKTLIKAKQLKGTYNMTINVNDLSNGLYLCVFKNQKETKTIKFLKISE